MIILQYDKNVYFKLNKKLLLLCSLIMEIN